MALRTAVTWIERCRMRQTLGCFESTTCVRKSWSVCSSMDYSSVSLLKITYNGADKYSLTFMERCEEYPEFAPPASLVGPQSHHPHGGHQHDIVGHRGAELILQVLDRAAAIVDGDKVTLALVWIVHLVLQKSYVDLWAEVWTPSRKLALNWPAPPGIIYSWLMPITSFCKGSFACFSM